MFLEVFPTSVISLEEKLPKSHSFLYHFQMPLIDVNKKETQKACSHDSRKDPENAKSWWCMTCTPSNNRYVCCVDCAANHHHGHKLTEYKEMLFFCDCSAAKHDVVVMSAAATKATEHALSLSSVDAATAAKHPVTKLIL